MDAREMTADELRALADEKAGETTPATRTVEVAGHQVTIDLNRLTSWKAFRIIGRIQHSEDGWERLDGCFEFVDLVAGIDEDTIVGWLGGDDADAKAVEGFVTELIAACYPKG